MKKIISLLIIVSMLFGGTSAFAAAGDKPSKWAEEDWEWAKRNKITDGSRPKDNATREEIVAMIRRAKKVQ